MSSRKKHPNAMNEFISTLNATGATAPEEVKQ